MTSRPTLLVVDPLPIFRELVRLSLAPLGRVVTAADDETAFAALRRERADLLLAYHAFPAASGPSLCERVKQDPELAHVPVILVTGGERPEQHAAAVEAGADDVLTRPLDRISLLAAARRLLGAPVVQGLPRIDLETPVRLTHAGEEAWGMARNLSRGGIFVETDRSYAPSTEVQLEFPLPGRRAVLVPTARVVWQRLPTLGGRAGLGLRFLGLDGRSAHSLEYFVREHRGEPLPQARLEAS